MSRPGAPGLGSSFSNATLLDSFEPVRNGTWVSRPSSPRAPAIVLDPVSFSGSSSAAGAGSCSDTGCCAFSDSRLPQRARISVLPSVSTVSPGDRRTRFFVQYTWLPTRYDTYTARAAASVVVCTLSTSTCW